MSKNNKPIMDETFASSFYTTSVPPERSGVNYEFAKTGKSHADKLYDDSISNCFMTTDGTDKTDAHINSTTWGYNQASFYCQYRLPCGICERTGLQCPKCNLWPNWNDRFIYTMPKVSSDCCTSTVNDFKITGNYTYYATHTPTKKELEDFFEDK